MRTPFRAPVRGARRSGFTLVELLAVIGIIVLLLGIFLPALQKARAAANAVKCESNLRTLMLAFTMWSQEHRQHLPGTVFSSDGIHPDYDDWLYGPGGSAATAPQSGTLYNYVNTPDVYLCPQMEAGDRGRTGGSNGKCDYAFFGMFAGAKVTSIPNQSLLTDLLLNVSPVPTPVLCQEDAYQFNGSSVKGDHFGTDEITHIHNKGGYYASIDCSVNFIVEPDKPNVMSNGCWQWTARTAHGNMQILGNAGQSWAWWDQN